MPRFVAPTMIVCGLLVVGYVGAVAFREDAREPGAPATAAKPFHPDSEPIVQYVNGRIGSMIEDGVAVGIAAEFTAALHESVAPPIDIQAAVLLQDRAGSTLFEDEFAFTVSERNTPIRWANRVPAAVLEKEPEVVIRTIGYRTSGPK